VEANEELGLPVDSREYGSGAQVRLNCLLDRAYPREFLKKLVY
jgi:hypothetical protein